MIVYLILWEVGKNRVEKYWSIVYCSVSHPKVFYSNRDVITAQFKRLLSYLTTDQRGVYLSCITCSETEPRFLQSCTRDHPDCHKQGVMKILFYPDPTENSKYLRMLFLFKKKINCGLFSVKLNTFKVKSALFGPMSGGINH